MTLQICHSCDYCGKHGLTILPNGVVYCRYCRLGGYDLAKKQGGKG